MPKARLGSPTEPPIMSLQKTPRNGKRIKEARILSRTFFALVPNNAPSIGS